MNKVMILLTVLLFGSFSHADLQPLNEDEMQSATGLGLGLVLDDFILSSDDSTLSVTGIGDDQGNPITVDWTQLYIMGEGSNRGAGSPTVDIGSYNNPMVLRTIKGDTDWASNNPSHGSTYAAIGDDIALFEFATSLYTSTAQNTEMFVNACVIGNDANCTTHESNRRSGIDFGSRFVLTTTDRSDYLDIDIAGLYLDGSHIRLWSRPEDGINGSGASQLNGNIKLNIYAEQIIVGVCNFNDFTCNTNSELVVDDFYLSANLGYGEVQPVKFDVTSDGNFVLEVGLDPDDYSFKGGLDPRPQGVDQNDAAAMKAFYDDFYDNAGRTNIYIDNIQVGSSSLGATRVENLGIHYLKITSQDI